MWLRLQGEGKKLQAKVRQHFSSRADIGHEEKARLLFALDFSNFLVRSGPRHAGPPAAAVRDIAEILPRPRRNHADLQPTCSRDGRDIAEIARTALPAARSLEQPGRGAHGVVNARGAVRRCGSCCT